MNRVRASRSRLLAALATGAACLCMPQPSRAEVVASGANGFLLRHELKISRGAAAAYARLVRVQDWWSSDHTYSGSAARLSLQAHSGGCWCEKLPDGGFAQHMQVVYAAPGKALRLVGGLGPLQAMGVSGALTFTLKAESADVTRVTVSYAVSGFAPEGFADLARAVDAVLAEQLARYVAASA
jgi:uncharacterized protein YndB with AHSA1/START domain